MCLRDRDGIAACDSRPHTDIGNRRNPDVIDLCEGCINASVRDALPGLKDLVCRRDTEDGAAELLSRDNMREDLVIGAEQLIGRFDLAALQQKTDMA